MLSDKLALNFSFLLTFLCEFLHNLKYCCTAKTFAVNTADIWLIHAHMQVQFTHADPITSAVLVIRERLHSHVLRVTGHGSQNKWMETAAGKWTQEMKDIITQLLVPFTLIHWGTSLGKARTLFTEYFKCWIWLKVPASWEMFNTFIFKAGKDRVQRQMVKARV